MARIRTYQNDPDITGGDKFIGTNIIGNSTNNFTIDDIAQYFAEIGNADPTRNAFPFTYAGVYTGTETLLDGQFRYQFAGSGRGPAQVTGIVVSNTTIGGVDFTPLVEILTRTLIKVVGVDTADDRRFAYYQPEAITEAGGNRFIIPVEHVSSSGALADDKINIIPSGSAHAGSTVIIGNTSIQHGEGNPNGVVSGIAGSFFIEQQNGITTNIFGPKEGGTTNEQTNTGWGVGVSLRGATGSQGATGSAGAQGLPGTDGTPGAAGTNAVPLTVTGHDIEADGDTLVNFSDGSSATIQRGQQGVQGDPGTAGRDGDPGARGDQGSFQLEVFRVSATAITDPTDAPTGGSYDDTTGLTAPTDWFVDPGAARTAVATGDLYESLARYEPSTTTLSAWSTPYAAGSTGPTGPPGTPGAPGAPGAPGTPGSAGRDADPLTVTNRTINADGDTVITFSDGEVATIQRGLPGTPGSAGTPGGQGDPGRDGVQGPQGRFRFIIYLRSATTLTLAPTGASYDSDTEILTPPLGWSETVPSGTDTLYESFAEYDPANVAALSFSIPIASGEGPQGQQGNPGSAGTDGNGISSITGPTTVGLVDTYTVNFTDGTSTTFEVNNGSNGSNGTNGNGIASISTPTTVGLVDTYTITFTDATTTTFDVTNGSNGSNGTNGVGISSISTPVRSGLVDTYTINYSDGTTSTFTVTNGSDGSPGSNGTPGAQGVQGRYIVDAFLRSATQPNNIVDLVYTPSTNTLTGTDATGASPWSLTIPSGTDNVYEVRGDFDPASGATTVTTWSIPFESGSMGPPGRQGNPGSAGTPGAPGSAGTPGAPGTAGVRGSRIFNGPGTDNVPSPAFTGVLEGDYFLNTSNSNIYGPATSTGTFPTPGLDLQGDAFNLRRVAAFPNASTSGNGSLIFLINEVGTRPIGLYRSIGTSWELVADVAPITVIPSNPTYPVLSALRIGNTNYRIEGGVAPVDTASLALSSNYNSNVFATATSNVVVTATAIPGTSTFTSVSFFTGTSTTPDNTITTLNSNNTYTHTYSNVSGNSNTYRAEFVHDLSGTAVTESETIVLTRAKTQPGTVSIAPATGDAALSPYIYGTTIENDATGTLTAAVSITALNGWTSTPTLPTNVTASVQPTDPVVVSQIVSFTPNTALDTASPQTASETYTRVNSLRVGNFTTNTLTNLQIGSLPNWNVVSGDTSVAEITSTNYNVTTAIGSYFYIAIPSSLVTGMTVSFREGPFSSTLFNAGIVRGYQLYRSNNQQGLVDNLTYTITIS